MSREQLLVPGFDVTSESPITPARIKQSVTGAYPYTNIGFIQRKDTAPDIVNTPELANFLWVETSGGTPTGTIRYYDGVAWQDILSQDGANILDATITIAKFAVGAADPFDLIQVNSDASGFQFISPASLFGAGTLPITALDVDGNTAGYAIITVGGVATWVALNGTYVINLLSDNTVPINKLIRGTALQYLRVNAAGTALEWATLSTGLPTITAGTAGKVVAVNSGETAYELKNVDDYDIDVAQITGGTVSNTLRWRSGAVFEGKISSTLTLDPAPSAAGPTLVGAHGLGAKPQRLVGQLVCDDAGGDAGYAQNDVIPLTAVTSSVASIDLPLYTLKATGTNVYVVTAATAGGTLKIVNGTTGAFDVITPSKWKIEVIAEIIN